MLNGVVLHFVSSSLPHHGSGLAFSFGACVRGHRLELQGNMVGAERIKRLNRIRELPGNVCGFVAIVDHRSVRECSILKSVSPGFPQNNPPLLSMLVLVCVGNRRQTSSKF